MKTWIVLGILAALLCACGGTAAVPTPAPTVAQAIGPLLIQTADIPPGDTADPVQSEVSGLLMYFNLPPKRELRHQELFKDGKRDGWTTVFLYPSTTDQKLVYQNFVTQIGDTGHPLDGIGEQSFGDEPTTDSSGSINDMVFVRCGAIAFISWDSPSMQTATDYAKRLDQRLTPILCK